jgi:2-phosphosulfolactate phosphatase
MPSTLEVLFTPAEFAALSGRDLSQTACVVFDVFRATSTIVTALANGAAGVIPVAEISDALDIRKQEPEVLLAGEREGLRIRASQTGGIDFDLGNSPREFTPACVAGKTIVLSTTNGSRALHACARARTVLVGSFLNLRATADFLRGQPVEHLLLVCSGTHDQAAYEDILGAGALVELLWPGFVNGEIADSATVARQIYRQNEHDLSLAVKFSRNGLRLLSVPDLRDDVAWCLQRDVFSSVAGMQNGVLAKLTK